MGTHSVVQPKGSVALTPKKPKITYVAKTTQETAAKIRGYLVPLKLFWAKISIGGEKSRLLVMRSPPAK